MGRRGTLVSQVQRSSSETSTVPRSSITGIDENNEEVIILFPPDMPDIESICQANDIDPLVANTMFNRGVEPDEMYDFLHAEIDWKKNPLDEWATPQTEEGLDRIIQAIENDEKIMVWGDNDADGQTSTAIMVEALRKMGADVEYYIPTRDKGFGVREPDKLQQFADEGYGLVVTVDCGTSDGEIINNAPIDVVVTDHHEPNKNNANLVINPYMQGDSNLAGAGVAWQTAWALMKKKGMSQKEVKEFLKDKSDLVAIGTIADMVDIVSKGGHNREMVKLGLQTLYEKQTPAIGALLEAGGRKKEMLSKWVLRPMDVTYNLASFFNTGLSRNPDATSDDFHDAVELLTTSDNQRISQIAGKMAKMRSENGARASAIAEKVAASVKDPDAPLIAVEIPSEDAILAGLVAGRLAGGFSKPAIVVTKEEDGRYNGSGRIPDGMKGIDFNMRGFVDDCKNSDYAGGHAEAFGMSVPKGKWDSFVSEASTGLATIREKNPDAFKPVPQYIDKTVDDISTLTSNKGLRQMVQLEPYADAGNKKPRVYTPNVTVVEKKEVPYKNKPGIMRWNATVADAKGNTLYMCGFNSAVCPVGDPGTVYSGLVYSVGPTTDRSSVMGTSVISIP